MDYSTILQLMLIDHVVVAHEYKQLNQLVFFINSVPIWHVGKTLTGIQFFSVIPVL